MPVTKPRRIQSQATTRFNWNSDAFIAALLTHPGRGVLIDKTPHAITRVNDGQERALMSSIIEADDEPLLRAGGNPHGDGFARDHFRARARQPFFKCCVGEFKLKLADDGVLNLPGAD